MMNIDREMPKKAFSSKVRQHRLSKITYRIFDITKKERDFLTLILVLLLLCKIVVPYPKIAMWLGFAIAGYATIANDSIQTIGTFIASNTHRKWWELWLFMGAIFIGTVTYSWWTYNGDVSYQRLTTEGFAEAPKSFSLWQLIAPISLLILTRMRIPVSTTFLLLNVFATKGDAILHVIKKSVSGYLIAFFLAIIIWYPVTRFAERYFKGKPGLGWTFFQWVTSGLLWAAWLMQDASNIAVFLPRQLDLFSLLLFIGLIFWGLGLLFYLKGDRMQLLINEKAGIKDIRAATLVDLVYMAILFYFKNLNKVPISTTWVFIGLLGGRDLSISLAKRKPRKRQRALKKSTKFIRRDLMHVCIGLAISILLAILVNPIMRENTYTTILHWMKHI